MFRQLFYDFKSFSDTGIGHIFIAVTKLKPSGGLPFSLDHHVEFRIGFAILFYRHPKAGKVVTAAEFHDDSVIELPSEQMCRTGTGSPVDIEPGNITAQLFVAFKRSARGAPAARLEFRVVDIIGNGYFQIRIECIVPGVVSVSAGILLVMLLMFYIMSYYVNPLYRMSDGVDNYRAFGKRHTYSFDGDDQLANINTGLSELIDENVELKRRVNALREDREKMLETINTHS